MLYQINMMSWVLLSMRQHMVMSLALVESNFLWETTFPPLYLRNAMSTRNAIWCKQFAAINYPFNEVGLVICVASADVVHLLLQLRNFLSGKSRRKCMKMQPMRHHDYAIQDVWVCSWGGAYETCACVSHSCVVCVDLATLYGKQATQGHFHTHTQHARYTNMTQHK
jgi:hypothetical protein